MKTFEVVSIATQQRWTITTDDSADGRVAVTLVAEHHGLDYRDLWAIRTDGGGTPPPASVCGPRSSVPTGRSTGAGSTRCARARAGRPSPSRNS